MGNDQVMGDNRSIEEGMGNYGNLLVENYGEIIGSKGKLWEVTGNQRKLQVPPHRTPPLSVRQITTDFDG